MGVGARGKPGENSQSPIAIHQSPFPCSFSRIIADNDDRRVRDRSSVCPNLVNMPSTCYSPAVIEKKSSFPLSKTFRIGTARPSSRKRRLKSSRTCRLKTFRVNTWWYVRQISSPSESNPFILPVSIGSKPFLRKAANSRSPLFGDRFRSHKTPQGNRKFCDILYRLAVKPTSTCLRLEAFDLLEFAIPGNFMTVTDLQMYGF